MGGFKTLAQAHASFAENDGIGSCNCIFVAGKDTQSQGMQGGLKGTLGFLGAVMAKKIASSDYLEHLYYDGLLINQTEKGFGIIPLCNQGMNLNGELGKMYALPDNYLFVSNSDIEKITIKDLSALNRKVKVLRIDLKNGQKIQALPKIAEKDVPYQEENFGRFMAKYI